MILAFETAAITIAIGAVLSVVLQGRLVHAEDVRGVPERVVFALRVVDVWLAVVFTLVVIIVIAVSFDALAQGERLTPGDREAVEHLLALAAVYPILIALMRRVLPILYRSATDASTHQLEPGVLMLPIVAMGIAAALLPVLIDPQVPLGLRWLLIGAFGALATGPVIAARPVSRWRSRRTLRRTRAAAAAQDLAEQSVTVSLPGTDEQMTIRCFAGSVDASPYTCWLDQEQTRGIVDLLDGAHRRASTSPNEGRWMLVGWPTPRLTFGVQGFRRARRQRWPRRAGHFFDATELLVQLKARMPISQPAESRDRP